jgi:hypothetical protein
MAGRGAFHFSVFEPGRLRMKLRTTLMLTLTGLVLSTSLASGQDATELKPFVGRWRAYVTEGGKSTPVEITVLRDGSYSTTIYTQPPRSARGRLEIVDGKFRFKSSDGGSGMVSLAVDPKGKRVLKAVRDDNGRSAQYEEVK